MAGFHEVQFPTDISYGSAGGPGYQTEIVVVDSGAEERISRWANPRRRYNVAYGIRSHVNLHAMTRFYIARRGAENGFRFKDWLDYTTSGTGISAPSPFDERLQRVVDGGVDGNGTATAFQLVKRYTSGLTTRIRAIEKPNGNSVRISINGNEIAQRSGSITTANVPGTTLIDASATFQSWGVQVGLTVTNQTDGSTGVITSVDSETQLTLSGGLTGGATNEFGLSDAYAIAAPWSVNSTSGVVTFTVAPEVGVIVQGGCEFDVPVRFDEGADIALKASIDDFSSGAVADIPLIEIIGSQVVDEEFYYGGGTRYVISASISITQLQGRVHVITADVGGLTVSLPDMTNQPAGGPHFYITNNGSNTFTVVNASSVAVVTLEAGRSAVLINENTNGDWYALKGQ